MATTYQSYQVAKGNTPRAVSPGVYSIYGEFALSAALVVNDVIQMVSVPNGARVLNIMLNSDDLDTAGPAIVLDVGDGNDTNRFIDGALVAQAATANNVDMMDLTYGNTAGFGYKYTQNDTIDVLVETGPTTGATTGTIKLIALLAMDD